MFRNHLISDLLSSSRCTPQAKAIPGSRSALPLKFRVYLSFASGLGISSSRGGTTPSENALLHTPAAIALKRSTARQVCTQSTQRIQQPTDHSVDNPLITRVSLTQIPVPHLIWLRVLMMSWKCISRSVLVLVGFWGMRVVDNSLITEAKPQCFRGLLISGLITSRPAHPFSQMEDLSTPYHPQPQRHLWSRTPETPFRRCPYEASASSL